MMNISSDIFEVGNYPVQMTNFPVEFKFNISNPFSPVAKKLGLLLWANAILLYKIITFPTNLISICYNLLHLVGRKTTFHLSFYVKINIHL